MAANDDRSKRISARWIEQDENVPVWRHAVWYDGVCGGLALGGAVALLVIAVCG